jgi:hypothetical protein
VTEELQKRHRCEGSVNEPPQRRGGGVTEALYRREGLS